MAKFAKQIVEENGAEEIAEKVMDIPLVQVSDIKTVKIKPNFSGKKYVGNTWYFFEKGVVITVPKNVKDILIEQNGITAV